MKAFFHTNGALHYVVIPAVYTVEIVDKGILVVPDKDEKQLHINNSNGSYFKGRFTLGENIVYEVYNDHVVEFNVVTKEVKRAA